LNELAWLDGIGHCQATINCLALGMPFSACFELHQYWANEVHP